MSDENKEIARRYVEDVWGQGDFEAERQIVAANVVDHNPGSGGARGLDAHHATLTAVRAAFPDMHMKLDLLVAEGDKVTARWTASATHLGDFYGMPPTAKRVEFTGMNILRIADGQIAEIWAIEDIAGLMQQLQDQPT